EVDHLDGKIFIDRLLEQKRKLYELRGKEWEEVEI
ncbi:MAG: peptide deformylase, partial [Candidatus Blackburnbacteria bacterium]|nr:peptide deformylase [Candidatus Blackburnbacteria bacterium]